jgi:hypothetical protein
LLRRIRQLFQDSPKKRVQKPFRRAFRPPLTAGEGADGQAVRDADEGLSYERKDIVGFATKPSVSSVVDSGEVVALVSRINASLDVNRISSYPTFSDVPQNVQDAANDAGVLPNEFRGVTIGTHAYVVHREGIARVSDFTGEGLIPMAPMVLPHPKL